MATTLTEYRPPVHTALDILHQDDALLVLNKPSGLLAVPGRGRDRQDCLCQRVQRQYPEALTVHRLDMDTSGLIVMARNKCVHRRLSRLFQERAVRKRYIALVDGRLGQRSGEIDLPLISDWRNRPRQRVDFENGKPSLTHFSVLQYDAGENTTRLELAPTTGRSHQLRVHLTALGHSILGDPLYASKRVREKADRLLLHASSLGFVHPMTGEQLDCVSEIPF